MTTELRRLAWGTGAVAALLLTVIATAAQAAQPLSLALRREIVRSGSIEAPNGGRLTDANCITGRLSTVDPRWAVVILTDSPGCVSRFGGATGQGTLVHRPTRTSPRWRRVGYVGDNCSSHDGGAPNPVLRDLGCAIMHGTRSP